MLKSTGTTCAKCVRQSNFIVFATTLRTQRNRVRKKMSQVYGGKYTEAEVTSYMQLSCRIWLKCSDFTPSALGNYLNILGKVVILCHFSSSLFL